MSISRHVHSVLDTATLLGATYADVRITALEQEHLVLKDRSLKDARRSTTFGISVRVIKDGRWGFGASNDINHADACARHACSQASAYGRISSRPIDLSAVGTYVAEWRTPIEQNTFEVPLSEKVARLRELGDLALSSGAAHCEAFMWAVKVHKHFYSTLGSQIEQEVHRIWCQVSPVVLAPTPGQFETLKTTIPPAGVGYEYFSQFDFPTAVERAVQHAQMKLSAPRVEPGPTTLILDPMHLWLTIHETCGHSTELDRAMGYEADYAGTSFLTPPSRGALQFGSPIVNIIADRSQRGGLATVGFDDDGVPAAQFPIISEGVFVNYQHNREFPCVDAAPHSLGCNYGDGYGTHPICRMPNISLMPGTKKLSLDELIADTESGLFVVGDGSWSIDQQRYNFQFTGQEFWKIEHGRLAGMVRDAAYQGNTVEFWNSCDAICDSSEYRLGGSFWCGKGQPEQIAPVSHGSSPARFRKVRVLATNGA